MVGFIKKKIASYTLGEKLQKLRQEANVSLDEIAKTTKIRKVYLQLLEKGEYEKLPPDVYVRGFLKNYAKFLSVDQEKVIQQYEKERGIKKTLRKYQLPQQKKSIIPSPIFTFTPNILAFFAFFVVIFAGIFYFYRELGSFSQTPRLVVVHPLGDASIEDNRVNVIGLTDKGGKVFINEQPILVNENGEFKEIISLQQGLNKITIKARNRFSKEVQKQYTISANYASVTPEEKVLGVKDSKEELLHLAIKVEELPTWIAVKVDGQEVYNGTMLSGAVQNFQAKDNFSVTSSRADKTKVIFNDQDLGFLAKETSVIRDVIFNRNIELKIQETN